MRSREEKKKCKAQETTIGKIIYGFLLFLPLLAIGVTCAYAIFNKNAYQSYSGSYQYLTTTKYNNYITNKNLNFESYTDGQYTNYKISSTSFNNIDSKVEVKTTGNFGQGIYGFNANSVIFNGTEYNNINSFIVGNIGTSYWYIQTYNDILNEDYFVRKTSTFSMVLTYNSVNITPINTGQALMNNSSNSFSIKASLTSNFIITDTNVISNSSFLTYSDLDLSINDNTLSSVFYSSIEKVRQSPLFSWAENNFIYTTTSATCTQLHITTPFIPLLISYWLIISVIYFLFDIALMLVWTIHKKIHELQESI